MTTQPRTSVIIPVFNGERFILEALRSVLDQLGEQDEVLVVDDASTDATRTLVESPDPRLKLLSSAGMGPSAARNVGLSAARGELIAFLDHDDLWPPERHRVLRAALIADASINAVAGRIRVSVESGGGGSNYRAMHGRHGPTLPWTCLFRRSLIDQVGLFDESLRYGEDLDYYARLVEAGMKLGYCDQDSLVYRRHAGNATHSQPAHAQIALALVARSLRRKRPLSGPYRG